MDWNPLHGAAFTGDGTPWGRKENQAPGKPNYLTDPSQVQGYDYTKVRKAMEQGLRETRARRDQGSKQMLAQANPYGESSETGRALGLSGAQTEADINEGNANIDHQDYTERMAALQAYNKNLMDEYGAAKKRSDDEDKDRKGFQNKVSSTLTLGLGG